PGLMIWTVIIFLALLAVLTKFAWKPILGALEARERRIQDILDAAARDRAEAERLMQEHQRQLAEARQQAQQITAEGRQAAERIRQAMLARARAEQGERLDRAGQGRERERERAREALRRDAVGLSRAAAAELGGKRLDSGDDRRIITEYRARIGAS